MRFEVVVEEIQGLLNSLSFWTTRLDTGKASAVLTCEGWGEQAPYAFHLHLHYESIDDGSDWEGELLDEPWHEPEDCDGLGRLVPVRGAPQVEDLLEWECAVCNVHWWLPYETVAKTESLNNTWQRLVRVAKPYL